MNLKIGDRIAYIKYDVEDWRISSNGVGTGVVFYIDEELIGCVKHKQSPYYIKRNSNVERYFNLDENSKQNILNVLQEEINRYKGKIRKLTANEKNEIHKNEFNRIKQQIVKTAENMVNSDDSDFINKLKAICDLKKQLFTIKISDLENIHKENGGVKYKISKLEELLRRTKEIEFR